MNCLSLGVCQYDRLPCVVDPPVRLLIHPPPSPSIDLFVSRLVSLAILLSYGRTLRPSLPRHSRFDQQLDRHQQRSELSVARPMPTEGQGQGDGQDDGQYEDDKVKNS